MCHKIEETEVLSVRRERREFLQKLADAKMRIRSQDSTRGVENTERSSCERERTNQPEYVLTDKLTVIGKSVMATVRLKGWLAPKVAAQISRREDNFYYIGSAGRIPLVNGRPTAHPTKLQAGDIIEVARVRLEIPISRLTSPTRLKQIDSIPSSRPATDR